MIGKVVGMEEQGEARQYRYDIFTALFDLFSATVLLESVSSNITKVLFAVAYSFD